MRMHTASGEGGGGGGGGGGWEGEQSVAWTPRQINPGANQFEGESNCKRRVEGGRGRGVGDLVRGVGISVRSKDPCSSKSV